MRKQDNIIGKCTMLILTLPCLLVFTLRHNIKGSVATLRDIIGVMRRVELHKVSADQSSQVNSDTLSLVKLWACIEIITKQLCV